MSKKRDSLAMTEAAFQAMVIEYATLRGWRAYSIPDSRKATARGWPDLALLHTGDRPAPLNRLRFAVCELKDDAYHPSVDQVAWLNGLRAVARHANASAGYEVFLVCLWRPCVWDTVQAYLDGRDWPKQEAA